MEESTKRKDKEKCFIMMPISDQGDYPKGHFTKVYEQIIKPAVTEAGYEPYRVDENSICDAIINKIFNAIQECPMALCDLSNRNPNVLYELGLRQAYDKPVVLIQDEKTDKIFDISGISTVFYNSTRLYEDVIEARANIKDAILSTKNKKMNSLVRIVKASTPDISSVEISDDDKVKVMLNSIMNEIRQINKNNIFDNKAKTSSTYALYVMELNRCETILRKGIANENDISYLLDKLDKMQKNIGREHFSAEETKLLLDDIDTIREQLIEKLHML